jgi:H+/Cl- antiporter ClcA
MPWRERLHELLRRALDNLRLRVSLSEALPQLALLGILCGLLAGGVMIAFRLLVETIQGSFLPGGDPENYEGLTAGFRVLIPLWGGLAVGIVLQAVPEAARNVGVVHVMERLAYHQGRLPLVNAAMQFFGAALSIVAGHSVGREGPAIHLGAACGSLPGQYLRLPNNSLRILAACGVAAAIAAAFNTPLAGVVFAMEVVMMEYTVVGFAPVILAAVSATALTRLAFGAAPAFSLPPLKLGSLWELPYVLAMGVLIGALAAAFIALLNLFTRRTEFMPLWIRTTLAGLLVGLCALPAPQIMGIGYDTVSSALLGELALSALLLVVVFKLLATTAGLGMGLPGGLIGPVLVIGAAAGGALGTIGQWFAPTQLSSVGFYALMGMGAMMAGALHAPLAALTAMLELSANPNIIWPDMLAVIAAYATSRQIFGQQSVFVTLLRARGLEYRNDPVSQSLRRVGVGAAMDRSVATLPRCAPRVRIMEVLAERPRWVLLRDAGMPTLMLPVADVERRAKDQVGGTEVELVDVPEAGVRVTPIELQATLKEALEAMQETGTEALYVAQQPVPGIERIYGVLTRADIERYYRQG